ncbi:MAG: FtsW/RodA/SpoVE family cell cycle protein [Clostridiales bacterium]|nr:FtsW/RodA/SpoVE family cell cycle protein [Clostridiales bacterium]
MNRQKSSGRFRFAAASVLLAALIFLVPALRAGNPSLYLLAVLIPCLIFLCETVIARMFSLDRMIMALVLWLCAAGIAALAQADPDTALTQSLRCGAALIALLIGGIMMRTLTPSLLTSSCAAFLGLLMLAGKLFSPVLPFPLTEAAMVFLLIAFASLSARQSTVFALLLGLVALSLLLITGSFADAVLWAVIILLLAFAADGRLMLLLPALAVVSLLFFITFRLRLFDLSGSSSSVEALVSAGAIGADALPESFSSLDSGSLFLSLAGHYGLIFAGLTALLFLPLTLRGTSVASAARTRFHAVLAMGASLMLALRALAAILSVFGFLPLSGLRLPFLTDSLPDLCAQLFLAGMLCGISGQNDADLAEDAHLAMLAK